MSAYHHRNAPFTVTFFQLLFWGKTQERTVGVPLTNKIHKTWMDQRNHFSPHPLHIQLLPEHPSLNLGSTTPAEAVFPLQRSALCIWIMVFSPGSECTTASPHCWIYCAVQPTHTLRPFFWQAIISKVSLIAEKVNQNVVRNIPPLLLLSDSFVWRKRDMLKGWLSCAAEK